MSEWIDQFDAKVRAMIASHGVFVFGSHTSDGLPWLHTIGLQAAALPELALIGVPYGEGHTLLNEISRWCFAHPGEPLTPGRAFTVAQYNPDLTFRAGAVSAAWCREHMNKLERFYPKSWQPGSAACVVQVLWPDEHGNHPGLLFDPQWQPVLARWAPPAAALTAPHHLR